MTVGAADRRQKAVVLFIVAWLAVQIVVPFLRKFELPAFRYRYARWSWAMFSRFSVRYQASVVRIGVDGRAEPERDLERFVRPVPGVSEAYRSVAEIEAWWQALLRHIAERHGHGGTWVATLRYRRPAGRVSRIVWPPEHAE